MAWMDNSQSRRIIHGSVYQSVLHYCVLWYELFFNLFVCLFLDCLFVCLFPHLIVSKLVCFLVFLFLQARSFSVIFSVNFLTSLNLCFIGTLCLLQHFYPSLLCIEPVTFGRNCLSITKHGAKQFYYGTSSKINSILFKALCNFCSFEVSKANLAQNSNVEISVLSCLF